MNILKRDSLIEGGFAGLKEHQVVKGPALFGPRANRDGSSPGIGRFVYLADARFMPNGETHMHDHQEIDIISVIVDGRLSHAGSLGHGQELRRDEVQVQRAGGEGLSHNEINPDNEWNRMIQLWALPDRAGLPAEYKVIKPKSGKLTRIYGGSEDSDTPFPASTIFDIAVLSPTQSIEVNSPFQAYLTRGKGIMNGTLIEDGDLITGDKLQFTANEDVQMIVVRG
ncbi:MAG: pirin family protein [Gammaproteobacteria bacterium]|nr:pirin family protein [Gammaproteobacteria bacterium]